MKGFLRSPPVVILLGGLIWFWMALIARTVRWRVDGAETARAAWAEGGGTLVAAWHAAILLLPAGWVREMRDWPGRTGPGAMLVSLSADGEPVARAIRALGLTPIRGSRGNRRKRSKDKGGARAIVEAVNILRQGGAVCMTPDGPNGPAEEAGLGPIVIAQRAGATLLPYALAVSRQRRLKTWDRFILPLPFSQGAIVFGDPLRIAPGDDPEQVRVELQRRMKAANVRAETLVARGKSRAPVAANTG